MKTGETNQIEAVTLHQQARPLIIESLDYKNPYDFQKLHRHNYFEIILIRSGSGSQLIDFSEYKIDAQSVFTIYPGQVHLMNRGSAAGLLIQFRKDIFEHLYPLRHYHLYFTHPGLDVKEDTFCHLYELTGRLQQLLQKQNLSPLCMQKAYAYLQVILISATEHCEKSVSLVQHNIITEFLSLLSENIRSKKKVAEYAGIIGCSGDKLNSVCKAALGKTALQLIHEEVMLEIKRLLLLNQLSLKEIAFELDFDSQANFSGFIKSRTGCTPTDLQKQVREIYK